MTNPLPLLFTALAFAVVAYCLSLPHKRPAPELVAVPYMENGR